MATSSTLAAEAVKTFVLATGGECRAKPAYGDDGNPIKGAIAQREGSDGSLIDVFNLNGVGITIDGLGLDEAKVSTGTQIEGGIKPGTIFQAEGRVEVTFRAEAKPGFRPGDAPRANLVTAVWIERLTPVGNAFDSLGKAKTAPAPSVAGGAK